MATAPTANDLTRQQLDELDDLLQRMLNLPLTGTEPPAPAAVPAAPAAPTWRYDAPAVPPAPTPHLADPPRPPVAFAPPPRPEVVTAPPPRPEPPPAPVPLIPPPEPTTPIIERKPVPPSKQAPPAPVPKPAPAPAAVAPTPAAPAAPEPPAPPVPVALWPLVGLNWVFDTAAGLLGPPGWLLRSGFGKNILGLAGVGLIAYTAAHLATEAGWVSLPFPVPWPR